MTKTGKYKTCTGPSVDLLSLLELSYSSYSPTYVPKSLFKFGEKRSIVCYYTHEQEMDCEGFTQNGCYGNQPQSFEVRFYRVSAKISCSFTKQDLTVN